MIETAAMPKLNRDVIRTWLDEHNWSVRRLAEECNSLGGDTISEGTMRNAVNGIDPMRTGRINLISRVTAKYGDGLTFAQLQEAFVTTGQPRAYVHLEIPADCRGIEASLNLDQQILFEFGDFPHEQLLLFHNCRALQQFVNLANNILEAPPNEIGQEGTTTEPGNTSD